ncbi:MAG: cation-translocating P-type ATPase [Planctomycetota bacterium]|nr:cation-translocating P-type ATPase [Planctomycetota bacterium]
MTTPSHATERELVLQTLSSSEQSGLSAAQVTAAREQFGWNELATVAPEPAWKKFLAQFSDVVVWILIAAAVISGAMGEWTNTVAILAIVLLNALLGFFQEAKAEKSLAALQSLAAPTAKVIRDEKLASIPARELVPGDLVEIEAGDNVPADLRLLTAFAMRVEEAALTGESLPVEKDAELELPESTPLADRRNMAYTSTVLANGQGRGVVVATGMETEIGRIAGLLQTYDRTPTPLQLQLAKLGRTLVIICLALVGIIFLLGLLHGKSWLDTLLSSVSLAVAAVPEGLPAVVTTALALGLQRMARRNALVRKLPSVETLGCVSVICSDKTGTLTHNEMTVRELLAGGVQYRVTGSGYAPQGEFFQVSSDSEQPVKLTDEDAQVALRIAAYCNHAQVQPGETEGTWNVIGDPTEGALIVLATKGGVSSDDNKPEVVQELPFDAERKAMSVLLKDESGHRVQYTKGAPEGILEKCVSERRDNRVVPLTDERRREIIEANGEMASRALRALALAYRDDDGAEPTIDENGLTFAGLVGMIDPPREEVKQAVVRCREAGIRPVMITGDHPATATSIARELGIASETDRVVSGQDLDAMSDDELSAEVEHIAVYARVAPEHKLRVVRAWKDRGEIVAMTGDGVNDAPAVKAADIGIAMGISGTDVTREASSMVLMDDNFASIVNAVEEGRSIYDNIQKFLIFLLSCNAGELMLMLFASLLGWPTPLLPVQLLWMNLVTDGFPALALAMEPPEPGLMSRPPRSPRASILSWQLGSAILLRGLLLAAVGLVAFGLLLGPDGDNVATARTMAFCIMVYGQLFLALAARSQVWTFWQLGLTTNLYVLAAVAVSVLLQIGIIALPFTRTIFDVTTHTPLAWGVVFALALIPVTVIELVKLGRQFFGRNPSDPSNHLKKLNNEVR